MSVPKMKASSGVSSIITRPTLPNAFGISCTIISCAANQILALIRFCRW
jgi:hypothetical protein